MNREINEAAQNCPNAQIAYNNYHNKISSVIRGFTQGKALLIDIHGQVKIDFGIYSSLLYLYYLNKINLFCSKHLLFNTCRLTNRTAPNSGTASTRRPLIPSWQALRTLSLPDLWVSAPSMHSVQDWPLQDLPTITTFWWARRAWAPSWKIRDSRLCRDQQGQYQVSKIENANKFLYKTF